MLPQIGNGFFPGEEFFNSFYPIAIAIFIGFFVGLRTYLRGGQYLGKERLDGKTAIVTGANSGIGLEIAKEFAIRGCKVILACKTLEKGEGAIRVIRDLLPEMELKLIPMQLDLSSFKSIRNFVSLFESSEKTLDILVNNAAIMCHPYQLTQDQFEMHFQVNYLGPYLLSKLLRPCLEVGQSPKVVNVTAHAYRVAKATVLDDVNFERGEFDGGEAFAFSKLAVLLSTLKLAEMAEGSTISYFVVNPGVVNTNLHRQMLFRKNKLFAVLMGPMFWFLMKGAKDGAQNVLMAALDPSLEGQSGKYLINLKVETPNMVDDFADLANKLYTKSEHMIADIVH